MQDKLTIKRVLDTTRPNTSKPIFAVSGDYSVRKVHAIIAADGDPIMVPVTAAVVISAERPDGASDSFAGHANGDGSVTVPVAQWMIAVEGEVECSVSVTTAAGKISTTLFYINVQKSPHIGEVSEDDPEYDLLALVLANENVRQANEENRVAAEAKREAAETAREDAEMSRAESEDARIDNESGRVSAEKRRETKFSGWERDIGSLPSFDARITRNSKRISNLEAGLPDDTFYEDSTVTYIKDVPANALPYAEVVEVGGMTRKCVNLIPFPYIAVNGSSFGVAYTINSDGTITFSGKATSGFTVLLCEKTLSAGSYYLSDNCSATGVNFVAYDIDADTALSFEGTFTLTKSTKVRVYYLISVGFDGAATVYPMLNAGETALPYEPYFEGLRSAKVESVESVGVNLFGGEVLADKVVSTFSGTKNEAAGTVSYLASNTGGKALFKDFKDNTVYTIIVRGRNSTGASDANLGVAYTDNTTEPLKFTDGLIIHTTKYGKTVRSLYGSYYSGTTVLEYNKCGIFKGVLTAEDFKPYARHTLTIPAEVQVLKGYGDGVNVSVYNYIDYEKKQFVKRVGKVDLGTLSWEKSSETVGGFFTGNIRSIVDYPLSRDVGMLCAKYSFAGSRSASPYYGEDKQLTCFISPSAASVTRELYVVDTEYTDAATFKAAMSGVMLVYELASPEVTDISDLLPADNFIPVEGGGTIRMVNEHGYDVPNTVVYQLENEVSA